MELPLIDALLAVIAQSSSLPLLERPLHRLAELASGSGGPYLLRYSEIGDCVKLLEGLLTGQSGRHRARAPWTSTPPVPHSPNWTVGDGTDVSPTVQLGGLGTDTPMVRAPWRDAVHGEGGTLVLVDETPVRLGPVGEVLWRVAAAPVSRDDAYAAVVAELGQHPDAARAVDDGLATLRDLALLRAI